MGCYVVAISLVILAMACLAGGSSQAKMNVLYIVVDDLRPDLEPYGEGIVHTPNIAALANKSLIFDRAYCQFAFCAPSRNSFMTGRRPDATECWNFIDHFRETTGQNWITMPEYFKNNGYFSSGVGKLYHPNLPPQGDPPSWSDVKEYPYYNPSPKGCPNGTAWCSIDPKKYNFSDVEALDEGLRRMHHAKNLSQPFFLGVGFHKPHLPFRSPTGFIEMYPPAVNISTAKNKDFPKGAPTIAWNNCLAGGHRYKDVTQHRDYLTPMEDDEARRLRRGYYAAISFTDSLVGKLLDELQQLGMAENTIISFHADHGWQLGEHNMWCKMSNFELGVRVPWMVHVPGVERCSGVHTSALAELVDVYPTLAELAGLPSPPDVDGKSQAPVFQANMPGVKNASFSQFPKCGTNMTDLNTCLKIDKHKIDYMGYSIRTDDYRYTEWFRWNGTSLRAELSETVAKELYDHHGDREEGFNSFENENIVELQLEVASQLSNALKAFIRSQFSAPHRGNKPVVP